METWVSQSIKECSASLASDLHSFVVLPKLWRKARAHCPQSVTVCITVNYDQHSDIPLMCTSWSSERGSPFIGSVPFSEIYFSTSLRSNTHWDTGDTQGCSGTSPLTKMKRNNKRNVSLPCSKSTFSQIKCISGLGSTIICHLSML